MADRNSSIYSLSALESLPASTTKTGTEMSGKKSLTFSIKLVVCVNDHAYQGPKNKSGSGVP